MKEPAIVLMDVDTGVDDALAILLALHSPRIRLVGITTVSGNTSAKQAAWNTRLILEDLNIGDGVPVRVGEGGPTPRASRAKLAEIHGPNGLGSPFWETHKASQATSPSQSGGVDFMIEIARKYSSQLSIVATSPLTNLASAYKREPGVFKGIKEIRAMGGAVNVPGNITPRAEFNVSCDPEAFDIVLHSGVPLTLFPLDVTERVRIYKKSLTPKLGIDARKLKLIRDIISDYVAFHKERKGFNGCFVHDALPVASILDPSLFSYKEENIVVDLATERGRTRRVGPEDGGVKIKVATGVRGKAVLALLWKHLATSPKLRALG